MTKLSNAEKQRLYRQRRDNDPERRTKYLNKEKEKYKADKASGKKTSINDKSSRDKRKQRKQWRVNYHTHQRKKKSEKIVISPTSVVSTPSPHQFVSRQRFQSIKTARDKLLMQKDELEKQCTKLSASCEVLQRKSEKYRKRALRSLTKSNTKSPRSKAKQIVTPKTKENYSTVRRCLTYHFALLEEIKSIKQKHNQAVKLISSGSFLRKYQLLEKFRRDINSRPTRNQTHKYKGPFIDSSTKQKVKDFYLLSDTSKITAGKRNTITRNKFKKQRRLLSDTMSHLYKRYTSLGNPYVSFSTFYRLKPFWVVAPKDSDRKTCQCKKCENVKMIALALWKKSVIQTWRVDLLLEQMSCSKTDKNCMYGNCKDCKSMEVERMSMDNKMYIEYQQWENVKEKRKIKNSDEKIVSFVRREEKKSTVSEVLDVFFAQMNTYKKHYFNMNAQFQYYKHLQDNIKQNECLIHVDFAENYVSKLNQEIQSAHFGASKRQISLHTGFFQIGGYSQGVISFQSFCGVSNSLQHDPYAIWAYLNPILLKIKEINPDVRKLYFFSDGPTAQYRQKLNFFLLSTKTFEKGFTECEWNFFEAGHGKGIPDGIGANVKRKADSVVKYGGSVQDAEQLVNACNDLNVFAYCISQEQIENVANSTPKLDAVKDTMSKHQLKCFTVGEVWSREVSCICSTIKRKNEKCCALNNTLKRHSFPAITNETGEQSILNPRQNTEINSVNETIYEERHSESSWHENDLKPLYDISNNNVAVSNNYNDYLARLGQCKSFAELFDECEHQTMTMRDVTGMQRSVIKSRIVIDSKYLQLVPNDIPCGYFSGKKLFPVTVRADGDCLPACGAIFAFGKDINPEEMRVRLIHELTLNADHYLKDTTLQMWGNVTKAMHFFIETSDFYIPDVHEKDITTLKDLFKAEVLSMTKPKSYMGLWELLALSSVLKMALVSVCPKVIHFKERLYLNKLLEPRIKTSKDIAAVMWVSTHYGPQSLYWRPNHFVPLLAFNHSKE